MRYPSICSIDLAVSSGSRGVSEQPGVHDRPAEATGHAPSQRCLAQPRCCTTPPGTPAPAGARTHRRSSRDSEGRTASDKRARSTLRARDSRPGAVLSRHRDSKGGLSASVNRARTLQAIWMSRYIALAVQHFNFSDIHLFTSITLICLIDRKLRSLTSRSVYGFKLKSPMHFRVEILNRPTAKKH